MSTLGTGKTIATKSTTLSYRGKTWDEMDGRERERVIREDTQLATRMYEASLEEREYYQTLARFRERGGFLTGPTARVRRG